MNKSEAFVDAGIKYDSIHLCVPQYTHSIPECGIFFKRIVSRTPSELRYIGRSVFIKKVTIQSLWKFELGSQESMILSIWFIVGFQQRNRQDSQDLNNDTFCSLPVTSAQCILGTENSPDAVILINYDDDELSQGCGQNKEAFETLTQNDIFKPYVTEQNFGPSNEGDDVGYNIYVFDIRFQEIFTAARPIEVKFKNDVVVTNDKNVYALVLTKNSEYRD